MIVGQAQVAGQHDFNRFDATVVVATAAALVAFAISVSVAAAVAIAVRKLDRQAAGADFAVTVRIYTVDISSSPSR